MHGGPPVTGAPYSATRTETDQQTLADGNVIKQTHTEKVYRDAEGRTRTEATMSTPSGTTHTMITISDPVVGFVAHLNPADSTAMKMTMPKPPTGSPRTRPSPPTDANAPKIVKSDLGTQMISGINATGTKTTITLPAGAMGNAQPVVATHEVWISSDLKVPVEINTSDPRHGTSTMLLADIAPGPQDPTLFQIPSDYTVKDAPAHHGFGGGPGGHGGPDGGPDGPPPPDGGLQ
jgi:hypothetical protein